MKGTKSIRWVTKCYQNIQKIGITTLVALCSFVLSACGPTATATPTQAPVVTQITLAPVNSPFATIQATTVPSGGTLTGSTTGSAPLQSTTGSTVGTQAPTSSNAIGSPTTAPLQSTTGSVQGTQSPTLSNGSNGTGSTQATAAATGSTPMVTAQSTAMTTQPGSGFVSSGAGAMATMSATEQALMEAAQAGCTDTAFMSRLSPDVSAASAIFKAFSATNDAQIAASLIQVNILSQRYEDLANVSPSCAITQLAFVSALANYSNAVALALSAKAVPNSANAASNAQQISVEMARANAFLAVVSKGVAGK